MKPETLLAEIGQAERHFNELQSRYRLLASTWVLAGFSGMGVVIGMSDPPVPQIIILAAIAIASSAGVQLLWIVDLFVYHRLLDANFLEGCRLEAKYPELPQPRWNMYEMFTKRYGVTSLVRYFYCGCSVVPLLGVVPIALGAIDGEPSFASISLLSVAAILIGSSICLFLKSNNTWLISALHKLNAEKKRVSPSSVTPP